uniref:beta-galactoside alpha-2,6-sialyltransferase 2 isoform X2 n=1 Tax=Myxine glutinosa TaxID=7769 RepID=UPI00358FC18C
MTDARPLRPRSPNLHSYRGLHFILFFSTIFAIVTCSMMSGYLNWNQIGHHLWILSSHIYNGSQQARDSFAMKVMSSGMFNTSNKRTAAAMQHQLACKIFRKLSSLPFTINSSEPPFSKMSSWVNALKQPRLDKAMGANQDDHRTCAVVSSAGALLGSNLGSEIDTHDYVMRFNSAPTAGFEKDVGRKTSIRLMNSQWFHHPDFDFFPTFLRRRQRQPNQYLYLIHPAFYWGLWDILRENLNEELPRNPPSSGFIGLMLMLWLCDEVEAYEFLPSVRFTDLCHYHQNLWIRECSTGAYHPLLLEKRILRLLSISTPNDVYNGRAAIHGFRGMSWSKCET